MFFRKSTAPYIDDMGNIKKDTIKKKGVWIAIAAVAMVLTSLALISIVSFSTTQQKLAQVTQQYQPRMLNAMQLTTHFYHSLSVLGNYMVEQDNHSRERYQAKVREIDTVLDELIRHTDAHLEMEDAERLATIRSYVDRIKEYNKQMLELADNIKRNIPAVGIAVDRLEPISVEMNQLINDILLDAEQQKQTLLISHIDNLRFNWTMVVSQIRNYIAFRNNGTLNEIDLYLEGVNQSLDSLRQLELNDDQQDLLEEFSENLRQYKTLMNRALQVHSSHEWRSDSLLMRGKITPTLRQLTTELEKLVSTQKRRIDESNADLAKQIDTAESTIRVSILIAFAIILAVIFLTMRTRGLMSEIRQQKEQKKIIQHQATHDELTKIPNRAYFYQRLAQAINGENPEECFTLFFIDLDEFKSINDDIGHDAGDFVLQETAHRLGGLIRKTDMVARLGGDEFIVIFYGMHNQEATEAAASKICESLRNPFQYQGHSLQIGCSIGIVSVAPEDLKPHDINSDEQAQLIVKRADKAMYEAKNAGKNGYCIYTGQAKTTAV